MKKKKVNNLGNIKDFIGAIFSIAIAQTTLASLGNIFKDKSDWYLE